MIYAIETWPSKGTTFLFKSTVVNKVNQVHLPWRNQSQIYCTQHNHSIKIQQFFATLSRSIRNIQIEAKSTHHHNAKQRSATRISITRSQSKSIPLEVDEIQERGRPMVEDERRKEPVVDEIQNRWWESSETVL